MRYTLNNEGYIETISFLHAVECNNKTCTEYTGTIPEGYSSLAEWSENAVIQAYKITNGNLTHDPDKEAELIDEWNNCSCLNIMTISLSENVTNKISTAWSYSKLMCNKVQTNLGNKLTFENGAVKIGEGVKHVKVSSNTMFNGIATHLITNITHNGSNVSAGYYRATGTAHFGIVALTPIILEVAEGDTIYLTYGAGATGDLTIAGGNCTYLTVEVLD